MFSCAASRRAAGVKDYRGEDRNSKTVLLRESAPGEGESDIESGELDGRGEAVGGGKRGDGWKGVDVGFEIAGGAVVWSV